MADTESVIAGAIADAREEGVLEPAESEAIAPAPDDEGEAETPAPEEKEDETPAADDEPEAKGEVETPKDDKKPVKAAEDDPESIMPPERDERGKLNRIPHPKVQKIVANTVRREIASVLGEAAEALGLDATKMSRETFKKSVADAVADVPRLRARVKTMDDLDPIMSTDGDRFVRILAQAYPKQYGRFVAFIDGGAPEAKEAPAAVASAAMPEPDIIVKLPDGSEGKTYSLKGMEARDQWLIDKILGQVDERVGKRVKPFEDAKANADQITGVQERVALELKDILDEARTEWEGFTENEEAIRVALKDIPRDIPMGRAIRRAYAAVVVGKLKTAKADMHKEILAEMKKAAEGDTGVKPGAGGKKKEDIIRDDDGTPLDAVGAAMHRAIADAKAKGLR